MFGIFILVIVVVVCVTVVPAVVTTVLRTLGGREGMRQIAEASRVTEARLVRIEEAIDAMALQIDRLRAAEERRYVSPGEPPRSGPPDS